MAEIPSPDPQAILKMIDAEMAMKRHQRQARPPSRTPMRVGSLIFLLVLLVAALFLLDHLAEVAREARMPEVQRSATGATGPDISRASMQ